MDIYQNRTDDVWFTINEQLRRENEDEPGNGENVSEIMYTRLKFLSEQHEVQKDITNQRHSVFTADTPSQPKMLKLLKPSMKKDCFLEKLPLNELNEYLMETSFGLKEIGKANFEGMVIDNGAARSLFGLPAFIRYCAYTGLRHNLKPRTCMIRAIGSGSHRSLGKLQFEYQSINLQHSNLKWTLQFKCTPYVWARAPQSKAMQLERCSFNFHTLPVKNNRSLEVC